MGRHRRAVQPMLQDEASIQEAVSQERTAPGTAETHQAVAESQSQPRDKARVRTLKQVFDSKQPHESKLPPVLTWPLILVSLLGGLATFLAWNGRTQPDDWASLWIGGLLMNRGQGAHLYDAAPVDFTAMSGETWLTTAQEVAAPFPHPYVQNPLFAKVLGLLTDAMSFEASVAWLLFLSGMSVVILIAASYHLWFRTTMPWGIAALVTAGVLTLPVVDNSLWLGQTTPLIVAGVAYGLAASRTRPWLAGIVLGIVATIKLTPYALIVVMLFFAYRRRAALWSLATTAVLAVWMFIQVDMAVISDWVDRLSDINSAVLVGGANQSLASTLAIDLGKPEFFVSIVRDYPSHVKMIPLCIALGVTLVTTVIAWWNPAYRFEILVIGAWLIAVTFSSILWTHYMLMLVTPVFGFAAMERTRLTRHWPYIGMAVLVILLSYPVTNPIAAMPFTGGFVYSGITAMLLALALLLVIGGCHAYSVQRSSGASDSDGESNVDAGRAASAERAVALSQPEPMILFDLVKRRS